ncbi:MAG: hypothetical protein F6I01_002080 [Aerococcus sanguinicola]
MKINEFKEIEYIVKLKNAYLTLKMDEVNYVEKGQFLICGILEKNGKVLDKNDFPRGTINTYDGTLGIYVKNGFFQQETNIGNNWIIHTPIPSEIGDIITLKHLQLYKL